MLISRIVGPPRAGLKLIPFSTIVWRIFISDSWNNPSVTRRAQDFVMHFFEKSLLCDSRLHDGVRFTKSAVSETVISSSADVNKLKVVKKMKKMKKFEFLLDRMLLVGRWIAVDNATWHLLCNCTNNEEVNYDDVRGIGCVQECFVSLEPKIWDPGSRIEVLSQLYLSLKIMAEPARPDVYLVEIFEA